MKKLICTILVSILSVACGGIEPTKFPIGENESCDGDVRTIDDDTVWLCGETNTKNVRQVKSIFDNSARSKLVIDSFGGDTIAAIDLATYIKVNDVELFVNNLCLSSCSQIIVVAANKVNFRDHSIFAMHDSQYATNIISRHETDSTRELANAETAFYDRHSIDSHLLVFPLERLGLSCVKNRDSYTRTGALIIKSDYDFYMPSKFELERLVGKEFPGYPQREEVRKFYQTTKLSNQIRINFSPTEPMMLSSIEGC